MPVGVVVMEAMMCQNGLFYAFESIMTSGNVPRSSFYPQKSLFYEKLCCQKNNTTLATSF